MLGGVPLLESWNLSKLSVNLTRCLTYAQKIENQAKIVENSDIPNLRHIAKLKSIVLRAPMDFLYNF